MLKAEVVGSELSLKTTVPVHLLDLKLRFSVTLELELPFEGPKKISKLTFHMVRPVL